MPSMIAAIPSTLQYLTANVSGKVRYVTSEGKRWLVAPLTLIVPGVLAGSQGPLMYRPEDIAANYREWHLKPLTDRHPLDPMTNAHLSAQDSGVLERQGIGYFKHPVISNGKLKGEAWFDIDKCNKVNSAIIPALKAGRPIEVSSGLYTTNVPAPPGSNHNGRPYGHYATAFVPDHCAVLLHETGACSIRDGCGLLVNVGKRDVSTADFITFPASLPGTNCSNCRYSNNGTCTYNEKADLRGLKVNEHTCCNFWDHKGTKRNWEQDVASSTDSPTVRNELRVERVRQESPHISVGLISQLFATLLHGATSAHILHLSSRSYGAHMALDELYKKLPKKVDKLVEVWQGQNTVITDWPGGYSPPLGHPEVFVSSLCQYVRSNRTALGDCPTIQNLVDDLLALLDDTLYRLRFLS